MTSTLDPPASDSLSSPRPRLILVALAIGCSLVAIQQTLVIPLLPALMAEFDASITTVTWVFTASLLSGAVATPLLSRFGDMYGKKPLILTALGLLLAGSVICALATSLGVLFVGRAVQGVSVAVFPLAVGVIRDVLPPARIMGAIGFVSATMGIGGTLGMLVTGLLATVTSHHAPVFWVAAVLSAASVALVARCVPAEGAGRGGRPDYPGAVLTALMLLCLLLAVSQGNAWGWTSGRVLGLFAASAVLCAAWVLTEQRVAEPLVRLSLLAGPRSLSANLMSLLLGFSMYSSFTLISNLIQTPSSAGYGLGGSVLDVGLYSLPNTVVMFYASTYAGRLAERTGPAFALAIGSVFAGASYFWLALSNSHGSDFVAYGVLQGLGFGIAYAALGTLAVAHVPMDSSGIASGVNSLVRTAGGAVAGAVVAAILTGGGGATELGDYVACFFIVAGAAWLAGGVALFHGIRYRR
ncbi:MFS transporter [Actinocorallia populi]|uniref:MFS transporter n=1 Tax=Actinocorallia populi TaxID=2079200 RepID=UPI000D0873CB|nr:MFS transporter [Actinocorallia populi]